MTATDKSSSNPFQILDEFDTESEVVMRDSPLTFDLLESGVTLKTLDERGQEVRIQFETASDDDEVEDESHNVTVQLSDDSIHDQNNPESRSPMKQPIIDIQKASEEGTIVVIESDATEVNLVYLCPKENCRQRFETKESMSKHSSICDLETPTHSFEIVEESESNLVISEDDNSVNTPVLLECMKCDFRVGDLGDMQAHIENVHVQDPLEDAISLSTFHVKNKCYRCPKCDASYQKKFHLVRHIRLSHSNPIYRCRNCTYQAATSQAARKHVAKCSKSKRNHEDLYSVASVVPSQTYKCVCTWCEYKSNKYSHVKKHIEIYHENTSSYPCKECVFVGQTVDDYAQHFNSFHKTDEYKHACTDCSFKCTNRTDMRNHYIEVHKKQRLFACKLCMYRAQDVMTIKKHISKTHSTYLFHCKSCNFSSNKKTEFNKHCAQVHGDAYFKTEGELFSQQIGQQVQEIVEQVVDTGQQVPQTQVLEEEIFEEQILEEQIEEEVISDFYEGSVFYQN